MPALPLALMGFATGTLALQFAPELPPLHVVLAIAAGAAALALAADRACAHAAWASRISRVVLGVLVAAAAIVLGFAVAAWRAELRLSDALPDEWQDRDIAVTGIIDDLPHASPRGTRFAFAVERVTTPGAHVPARISLAWYPPQRAADAADVPPLRAGERWQLTVRLKRPHGNVNPHGFDLEAWLLENEFRATGYVRAQDANARITAFAGRPYDWVQRAREHVRDRIVIALPAARYQGVIVALAIGEQRAIPESQWLVFNRTGITHLISISGLHVTVFAALAAMLVHALARRSARLTSIIPAHRVAAIVGALCAFGYVLLAGAQIPAQRTFIMLAVAAVGLWLARLGSARMVWLWALVIVLAFDPWAGLTPGFWLSFGAVALLLYAGTGRLQSAPSGFWARQRRAVRAAADAQTVVTLGLVPLTLAVFQQVSLIAPAANALAIPVVTFAVVPLSLGAIALPFQWPWQWAHAIFALLMLPLEWLAQVPGALWQQHAPQAWTVVASIIGVILMLAPRGIPLRALGLFWLLPLFVVRPAQPAPGTAHVVALDVGQGLAVLVHTASHALLYDSGPRFNDEADAGGRIIVPYLRAAGIERLSMLVVSHLDADHSGGVRAIAQTVPIERYVSSVDGADRLWQGLRAPVDRCVAGEHWVWDDVRFSLVHPPADWYAATRIKTNDMSCVLRVETASGSVLLTGDVEAKGEASMLQRHEAVVSDVLVVPHHGSRTSSTQAFINEVRPRIAVFTPGYRNRFGHPREDVVDRYRSANVELWRTDLQGAVSIVLGESALPRVLAERERQRRYWFDAPKVKLED